MEYCPEGDLKNMIEEARREGDPIEENKIWSFFTQMLIGLEQCHNHKDGCILHRDLKPSNIFLGRRGMIKLGDFGLSKQLSIELKCAQTNVGSPYYMSPE